MQAENLSTVIHIVIAEPRFPGKYELFFIWRNWFLCYVVGFYKDVDTVKQLSSCLIAKVIVFVKEN